MNLKKLAMIAFALCTVTLNTACPRDIANDLAEQDKLVKEYNSKADEANGISRDLSTNHSVFINRFGVSTSSLVDWSSKSADEKTTVRAKLTRYLELVGRLIELSGHKNVKGKTDKEIDVNDLRSFQDSANGYLQSLNKADGKAA